MIQKEESEVKHPNRWIVYHDNQDNASHEIEEDKKDKVSPKENLETNDPWVLAWAVSQINVFEIHSFFTNWLF